MKTSIGMAGVVVVTCVFAAHRADAQIRVFKQFPGQVVMIHYDGGPGARAAPSTGLSSTAPVILRIESPVVSTIEPPSLSGTDGFSVPRTRLRRIPKGPLTSWKFQQLLFKETGNEKYANAMLATRYTGTHVARRLKEPPFYAVAFRR